MGLGSPPRAEFGSRVQRCHTPVARLPWQQAEAFLLEASLLAALGGVAGVGLGYFGIEAFNAAIRDGLTILGGKMR